jgi:hypothetical protein
MVLALSLLGDAVAVFLVPQDRGAVLRATQVDVIAGGLVSNVVTWAVLVTTAATLHARGVTSVESATWRRRVEKRPSGQRSTAFAPAVIASRSLPGADSLRRASRRPLTCTSLSRFPRSA